MKTLDMADKYDPLSYQDDEPTVKINMEAVLPKVIVDDDDFEPTLPSARSPVFPQEKKDPRLGLILILAVCVPFWATVAYFIFR